MTVLDLLLDALDGAPALCGGTRVLAIDGGAAAGKSTLAAIVRSRRPGALVATDDLLDGWDGQFGYAGRLREGVLAPLAAGRSGNYRRYDWVSGRFADDVTVPPAPLLIVEGVGSIQACGRYLGLGVYLDVDRATRERRWRERDGPLQPPWRRWLDREDEFFDRHRPDAQILVLRPALKDGSVQLEFAEQWTVVGGDPDVG